MNIDWEKIGKTVPSARSKIREELSQAKKILKNTTTSAVRLSEETGEKIKSVCDIAVKKSEDVIRSDKGQEFISKTKEVASNTRHIVTQNVSDITAKSGEYLRNTINEENMAAAAKAAELKLHAAAASSARMARDASESASKISAELARNASVKLRQLGEEHEAVAEHADIVAKTTRVVAGVATAGAVVAAPTGLSAIGVAAGIASAPVIVTAAPVLVAVAGGAFTVSAAASLYSKSRRNRDASSLEDKVGVDEPDAEHTNQPGGEKHRRL